MDFIIRPRGGGKTTEILKKVKACDGGLLVFSYNEVKRIERLDKDMIGRVFIYEHLKSQLMGLENIPIFIDNADYCLRQLVKPLELKGISMSVGE